MRKNTLTFHQELLQQRTHLSQHDREQERTVTHLRVIEAEIAQAQTEQADVESKLLHAQTELTQARLALTEAVSRATATSEIITQIRQVATTRMQELSSRRADFAAKSERRKGLQQDIRRLENESEEIKKRFSRMQLEASEAQAQIILQQEHLVNLGDEIHSLMDSQEDQLAQIASHEAALAMLKEKLAAAEISLTDHRNRLNELREARVELDILRTKLATNQEHLAAACLTELGENLTDLLAATDLNSIVSAMSDESDETPAQPDNETDFEEDSFSERSIPGIIHSGGDFDLESGKRRLDELSMHRWKPGQAFQQTMGNDTP